MLKVGTTGIRGQTSVTEHTGVSLRGVLDVGQLNLLWADRYGGQSLLHLLVTSSLSYAGHRGSDLGFIRLETHFLLKSDPGPANRLSQAQWVLFDRLLEFVLNLVLWVEYVVIVSSWLERKQTIFVDLQGRVRNNTTAVWSFFVSGWCLWIEFTQVIRGIYCGSGDKSIFFVLVCGIWGWSWRILELMRLVDWHGACQWPLCQLIQTCSVFATVLRWRSKRRRRRSHSVPTRTFTNRRGAELRCSHRFRVILLLAVTSEWRRPAQAFVGLGLHLYCDFYDYCTWKWDFGIVEVERY